MADKNDDYKLKTRRYLAWGATLLGLGTCAFVAIWSIIFSEGCQDLASLALGIIGTTVGGVIGYFFSKKVKEE